MTTLSAPAGWAGTHQPAGRRRSSGRRTVPPGLPSLLLRFVAIAILAAVGALVAWSSVPAIWGWTPVAVVSESMSPSLHRGDVAVTSAPPENWTPIVGQVVVVPDPQHPGQTRIHRISGIDENGLLITRGDANGSDDSFRTAPDQVKGIGRLLIPGVALATLDMREGDPAMFVAQTVAVLGAVALVLRPARRATPDGLDGSR
ncbi:S26 family signal peptidase [Couchioplanes caeruleus]|nr:S26 family signal peptidase [Couchioplanes caeruleus]ROP32052.1 signal peptidase [Couchioplanes caeruleus]